MELYVDLHIRLTIAPFDYAKAGIGVFNNRIAVNHRLHVAVQTHISRRSDVVAVGSVAAKTRLTGESAIVSAEIILFARS